jgi:FkbM family methyltransferase
MTSEAETAAPAPSRADELPPAPPPQPRPPLRRRALKWIYWVVYRARTFLLTPLQQNLAAIEAAQARLADTLRDASAQTLQAQRELQRDMVRLEAQFGQQITDLRAQLEETRAGVAALPPLMGPRFDELEIKIRPLIDFDAESYAVRLADGYLMSPKSEPTFTVMLANAPSGGLEAGTRRVLRALIEPGMTIADVGANVGLLTLACARATGPSGQVHAFEPEVGPRRQLEKTCALNGLSWVKLHAAAVGRTAERRTFHVSPIIGHSSLYALPIEEQEAARDVEVEVVALDGLPQLDVVKIDVEGAELDVLAGMAQQIAANPNLAIVAEFGPSHLERLGVAAEAWWDAFAVHGFTPYAIAEPGGACTPASLNAVLRELSTNLVFVRPGSSAEHRLPRS